ncbi:GntR family transcriptional regulator [Nocardioides endophyticus]|uniref:GntR family transcriptional regulator n=1 Tax=Nocardioides endophyticus TaxID=1353775 RepID=A0ABP8YS37_9ACTN
MTSDLSGVELGDTFSSRRTSADVVADALRTAIRTGALPEGAVLNQGTLAERFSISRQPVREAMRQLMAEGLIETRAHHGSVVRRLPVERLAEIYEHRALLEGAMIGRATGRIPAETIADLRVENAAMKAVVDVDVWLTRNREFHRRLVEPAGDETGLELVDLLQTRAERYDRMWSGLDTLHQPGPARDEYDEILDAIESGDGTRAGALLAEHIRAAGRRLVEIGTRLAAAGPPAH